MDNATKTVEVELRNSEPSAVAAVRATFAQAPLNAELLEKGGRFFLRGSDFAFFAAERQGYVKRIIGQPFEGDAPPGEALPLRPLSPVTDADVEEAAAFMVDNNPAIFGPNPNPAITLRPHPGRQSDFVEVGWESRWRPSLDVNDRARLLNGTWMTRETNSPRPWSVKTMRERKRPDREPETVHLVLDANGKCVAECSDPHDAVFIAHASDPAPVPPRDPRLMADVEELLRNYLTLSAATFGHEDGHEGCEVCLHCANAKLLKRIEAAK